MERLRRRIDSIVEDKQTAEALKPYYRFMCKRPCSNDDYLPTFNRPNVTLVDVSRAQGRRTHDRERASSPTASSTRSIASSSRAASRSRPRSAAGWGIDAIEGRNGLSLYDHWADGYKTFHGMTSHGFPNQFFTGFTQGGVQREHHRDVRAAGQAHRLHHQRSAEARRHDRGAHPGSGGPLGQDDPRHDDSPDFLEHCTPGYYNNEGGGAEASGRPSASPTASASTHSRSCCRMARQG